MRERAWAGLMLLTLFAGWLLQLSWRGKAQVD
jgi:hypothetical protein